MPLPINGTLGTVRIDVTTDSDHIAKYGLYLWRQLPNDQWQQLTDCILPETSHTLDPQDHSIKLSPAELDGCWLVFGAKVNSLVEKPGPLDLRITVRQDPGPPGTVGSRIFTQNLDHTKPVTPGKELNLSAEYQFKLK